MGTRALPCKIGMERIVSTAKLLGVWEMGTGYTVLYLTSDPTRADIWVYVTSQPAEAEIQVYLTSEGHKA